ncbi:MAG TPA: DUF6496 domain-containing protein [Rhizomicrobium sp.]|nr:DUF6496 domain-containing protein [Rhizomicrobium sp.]
MTELRGRSGHSSNTWRTVPFRSGTEFCLASYVPGSNSQPQGDAMARKYSKGASKKVKKVMHERKKGTLKSGSGRKVKDRKQAIAIGLSEARKAGKKVPKKAKKKSKRKSKKRS